MDLLRRLSPALLLALTACAPVPGAPPAPEETSPAGVSYHVQAIAPLTVVATAVDSESAPKAQMTDGNAGTAWTNGGFKNATAWASLQFAAVSALGQVQIKTGPSPAGTKYDVQVSSTGTSWTTVLANQVNTSWNIETKTLPAGTSGKFLRILWHNSPTAPQAHFSIYELSATGTAGTMATNRPPTLGTTAQAPLNIEVGASGKLTVQASDPDGDALTYTWHATKGTLTGTGASVTYTPTPALQGPNQLDDQVTVTVSDGKASASKTFTVNTFLGTTDAIQANTALEWAPVKTAFAGVSGNVTVTASGFFSVYNAVIAEYTTSSGRRMALLKPGTTVLPGVTGNVFMYLIGPTGANTPSPNITVKLNTVTRTITKANIVASQHVGYQPSLGPGNAGFLADLSTAKNGAVAYQTLLDIRSNGLTAAPGLENQGTITYSLLKPGDFFFGFDGRVASGDADERVVLTDSQGGLGDNTGSWTIDVMAFDH